MNVDRDALSIALGATEGPQSPTMQQCIQTEGLVFTSGHTSLTVGRVGDELTTAEGRQAAHEATLRLLTSVRESRGTLNGMRPVQLTVFVHSTTDFTEHGEVAEGASALLREVFGGENLPTRKALGMASLPRGVAVELDLVLARTTAP